MADKWLPWIGVWQGKKKLFEFMGIFGENFQTTAWDNTDAYASGDTVAVFGKMNAITTESGKGTGPFTFAPPKCATVRSFFGMGSKTALLSAKPTTDNANVRGHTFAPRL
ncbi:MULTISPECIES: nuclear transport factor 2 family protein [Falsihalocynthiibacter]|uniref:nuclear transport factor 2 family protein n=1 Tax=Falsihalocynthiibacter TaxID=2854182 RepID=UPI0030018F7E